jgi:hypothetical protein
VFEIYSADGEKGKGISASTMNEIAQLNNDMKVLKMKRADWEIIKEDLEAGVPGMQTVTEKFMKRRFSLL